MTYYVFSTLSQDNRYVKYKGSSNASSCEPRAFESYVEIKGGAGVANNSSPGKIWTPRGICNPISDAQYDWLTGGDDPQCKNLKTGCQAFKKHFQNGFLKIEKVVGSLDKAIKSSERLDVEKSVRDLNPKDKGAQPTVKEMDEQVAAKLKEENAALGDAKKIV